MTQQWPICEGLIVTEKASGQPHLAPMGPFVSPDGLQLQLRPFQSSRTFGHLMDRRRGVFHVTDDVELLAQAAIGRVAPSPNFERTPSGSGWYLPSACRWMEFEITQVDVSESRSVMQARVTDVGTLRDFFGFHRARHAVVEAAILATRVGILDREEIETELKRLQVWVDKTGTAAEHRAFQLLCDYVDEFETQSAEVLEDTPTS